MKKSGTKFFRSVRLHRRKPWEMLLLFAPSLGVAAEYDVTSQTDLANAITSIDSGSGGDTIVLENAISLTSALPSLSESVTVQGQGFSISGSGAVRIFDVTGGQLSVVNAALVNGRVTGGIGGSYNGTSGGAGGSSTISNIGTGGYGSYGGYGYQIGYSYGSGSPGGGNGGYGGEGGENEYSEYISTGKNSGYEEYYYVPYYGYGGGGGGGLGAGGAVALDGGSASFQNVTFSSNIAYGGQGGYGAYYGNGGSGWGGAIFVNSGQTLTLTNASFSGDQVYGGYGYNSGGAAGQDVDLYGGTLHDTVSSGSVTANIASTYTASTLIKDGAGTLNDTGSFDGTISVNGGTLIVAAGQYLQENNTPITVGNGTGAATLTLKSGSTLNGITVVGSGGTLGGSGFAEGPVTVGSGGATYPGDPQVLQVETVHYQAGSSAQFGLATTLASSHPPTAGTDYDQIAVVNGSANELVIDPGAALQLNLSEATLQVLAANADNNVLDNYFVFTLGTAGTSSGQFTEFTLDIDGTDYTTEITDGDAIFRQFNLQFMLGYTGNAATNSLTGGEDVSFTPAYIIPEPSTWLLLSLGLGGVAVTLRRRANPIARP